MSEATEREWLEGERYEDKFPEPLGYVVIEWNQASGQPRVCSAGHFATPSEASEHAAYMRRLTKESGRRERYTIAAIHPLPDTEPSA